MIKKICECCGLEFDAKSKDVKFCSKECRKNSRRVRVVCSVCGKVELVPKSRAKKYVTCSKKCGAIASTAKNNTFCSYCGKPMHRKASRLARSKRSFCSSKCKSESLKELYKGANNPNFKDIKFDSDGYSLSMRDGRKIKKHICIALTALNVDKIPKGFHVHHRDSDKLNNDPLNLAVLSVSDHVWIHKNYGRILLKQLSLGRFESEEIASWSDDYERALRILNTSVFTK